MPAILHPLPKIVKKFNTITFTGGTARNRLNYLIYILNNMEAEGGIEPTYTAFQAVDHRLFLHLINGLHRKSDNPLLKPTP